MNTSRNYYHNDVDFSQLALQDKEFNKYLKTNGQVNFGDPAAVKQLTLSLLKRDFSLSLNLPNNRLCPPIPNRFNYILWLQDLLDQTTPNLNRSPAYTPSSNPVLGIDIGTGSSAIYPLLGCAQRATWRFLATDIDAVNLDCARRNVISNSLEPRIKVVERRPEDHLLPLDVLDAAGIETADFVMCNPPFFASTKEMLDRAAMKSRPPFSACTGAEVEMVVVGGEVAFVGQLVEESAKAEARDRVRWFTSMLGKLSSVSAVVERVRALGCRNWCVTEFVQGNKTRRWAVAWSWGPWRPEVLTARGVGQAALGVLGKNVLPFPSEMTLGVDDGGERPMSVVGRVIDEKMSGLSIRWQWHEEKMSGIMAAKENAWSRSARRKKKVADEDKMDEDVRRQEPTIGVMIQVKQRKKGKESEPKMEVELRWLVGQDSVLFESFCGMLKRTLLSSPRE